MLRTLLVTTALAGFVVGGAALAQTSGPASAPTGDRVAPAGADPAAVAERSNAGFTFLTVVSARQHLFSDLVGAPVFLGTAPDGVAADIEDVAVGADGTALALVLRTQGAIEGESRVVAVPFDRFTLTAGEGANASVTLDVPAQEIAAAPAFTPDGDAAQAADAGGDPGEGAGADADPAGVAAGYLTALSADQYLAGALVDDVVHAGPSPSDAAIGNIEDLVIGEAGAVDAFVVGVGGFLGIGEKNVGVPFDAVALGNDSEGQMRAALAVTRGQLEAAPTFEGRPDGALTPTASEASNLAGAGDVDATATVPETSAEPPAQAQGEAVPMDGAELTADALIGTTVYGPDRETIGDVSDIALSAGGLVDAIVIDVGGFLGIGSKPVAVSMDNLRFTRDDAGSTFVTTAFTKAQLEAAPAFDSQTYAQNRDTMRLGSPSAAE